jgi:hypothetical protein
MDPVHYIRYTSAKVMLYSTWNLEEKEIMVMQEL